jgi:hypothetical protein
MTYVGCATRDSNPIDRLRALPESMTVKNSLSNVDQAGAPILRGSQCCAR